MKKEPNVKLTTVYHDLAPYEVMRYRAESDGKPVGFVSRFRHDGASRWTAWRSDGLRQVCRSRRHAVQTLIES